MGHIRASRASTSTFVPSAATANRATSPTISSLQHVGNAAPVILGCVVICLARLTVWPSKDLWSPKRRPPVSLLLLSLLCFRWLTDRRSPKRRRVSLLIVSLLCFRFFDRQREDRCRCWFFRFYASGGPCVRFLSSLRCVLSSQFAHTLSLLFALHIIMPPRKTAYLPWDAALPSPLHRLGEGENSRAIPARHIPRTSRPRLC